MDFSFSEEQLQLKESVRRFVEREYQPQQHRNLRESRQGFSEDHWSLMCKLGWTGLAVAENAGGCGGSIIDVIVLCEELGRGPILEPYLPTLLSAQILSGCDHSLATCALTGLIHGKNKVSTAIYEPGARFSLDCSHTRAAQVEAGFVLNGHKTSVMYAQFADKLIVAAKIIEAESTVGLGLFLLDSEIEGLAVHPYRTIDGQRAAELVFEDVLLPEEFCMIRGLAAEQLLKGALNAVLIGLASEALGAMGATLESTVAYCKERKQFGQPISKFQVLQHRMADMFIACEGVRSLLYAAAASYSQGEEDTHTLVAALKNRVAETGRLVAEQAVQLHGGMGFTEDLHLSQYYKRLICNAVLYGDADHYLSEYVSLKRRPTAAVRGEEALTL
ncbi:MAG: acyl-CoA dehydrogenase family protein [Halieaceae bacterium]|nr:acyl-CoA dehydrogenase family protein [Halieaceae bacterium]